MLEYMPYKACEPLLACLRSAGERVSKRVRLRRQRQQQGQRQRQGQHAYPQAAAAKSICRRRQRGSACMWQLASKSPAQRRTRCACADHADPAPPRPTPGANGKNGKNVPLSKQFITEAYADQGPVMRRFRPRAQGR